MRKIIILSAATLILSSCGIYNKYKPVSEVPEGLYGSESVAATDTANFGNLSWREVFTDPYLQNLVWRAPSFSIQASFQEACVSVQPCCERI